MASLLPKLVDLAKFFTAYIGPGQTVPIDDPHPDIIDAYLAALRAVDDLSLPPDQILPPLGTLIDLSQDLARREGVLAALAAGDRLLARDLDPEICALLHYFLANALEVLRVLTRSGTELWAWEQPELEQQIVHLRSALELGELGALSRERVVQVLTNLGNAMSHCGRVIEAIAYWERALLLDPDYAMTRGNRGYAFERLAILSHDQGHQRLLLRAAHTDLRCALEQPLATDTRTTFTAGLRRIERWAGPEFFDTPSHEHAWATGMPPAERAYREWCLDARLFLNDLNEIGRDPVAAADVLVLPDLVTPLNTGPGLFGFFNQMKQEYVSARYLMYEGMHESSPHFSDREVLLLDTLDSPAYGLATERVKLTYRMAYSLLDKVAFFLNDYLELAVPLTQVSFKKLWFGRTRPFGLRADVQRAKNTPLLGLFWLSKDLFEDDPGFRNAIEPDARELESIRQHLEHKYLKLHTSEWSSTRTPRDPIEVWRVDTLAYPLLRDEFEARTLRLLRMARAALLYLVAAVYVEERSRQQSKGGLGHTVPVHLNVYDDDRKH